ncbi:SDR family NAD(P)-dependent oxidoreductase [Hyphomicrobium sp. CS1GBMeth3]|uniref:SDR family NAD(P)-dependent oxidoreductase n=1 Tax=Hyphomicrobium sp. CS1GBMeth3 TaxID=1892845 RepID=UPI000A6FEF8F|nr:SDR family NAD(P)-dependent oxidoreductase [Hyphomicrobium sp. CS1GBMeth3]
MSHEVSAARTFSAADQLAFARLSGDYNPIHVDACAARRTQAGAPVVHGVHGALWALEKIVAAEPAFSQAASLKIQFPKFMYLDSGVEVRLARRTEQAIKVELTSVGVVTTIIDVKFGARPATPPWDGPDAQGWTLGDAPLAPAFPHMADGAGWIPLSDGSNAAAMFPALSQALGTARVEALARLSTLVGMICPGLHSIFSSLAVDFVDEDASPRGIRWQTVRTDDRFRLVTMKVLGCGIAGQVQAFMRAEPVEPPSIAALSGIVAKDEFSQRKALVIGGSRGLGAVTAKLLAAGGAQVYLTYATGRDDADAIAEEICAGRGEAAASTLRCNVLGDFDAQLAELPPTLTHLYYFATPRIAHQATQPYTKERFDAFAAVYVDGFARLLRWALVHTTEKPHAILYPSTAFIEERPKGMAEYAMAKAAGEILAAELASTTGISISAPRIPRVLTDQTATVLPLQTEDPVAVILPLLRAEP